MRARSRFLRSRSPFIPVVLRHRQSRRGFSLVLFCVGLVALIAFVTLAVDIGRLRLARSQLQNAADAAALASASSLQFLPSSGVTKVQDAAIDTAAENTDLDQANSGSGARDDSDVQLDREEDVQFGIWRPDAAPGDRFFALESSNGGVDERREANAVRVWARRCTTYTDEQGTAHTRNTGIPLIFGPVIGVFQGEAEQKATVRLMGGMSNGFAFVGFHSVSMNGSTKTDSYDAAHETYPGVGGANQKGSLASNGDITLTENATVWGDVHPGVDGSIKPYPLSSGVQVTGFMDPLQAKMVYPSQDFPAITFNPPPTNNNSLLPASIYNKGKRTIDQKSNATIPSIAGGANYVLTAWKGTNGDVTIQNDLGPVNIFISGDFSQTGQAVVHVSSASSANPVTFWVKGAFKEDGGGIINPGLPANLIINVTNGGSVDLGGNAAQYAHVNAPLSDVKVHGTADFWGWITANDLTFVGTMKAHYDESRPARPATAWNTHMVE
jgi:Flp pilus assembly protein TadG